MIGEAKLSTAEIWVSIEPKNIGEAWGKYEALQSSSNSEDKLSALYNLLSTLHKETADTFLNQDIGEREKSIIRQAYTCAYAAFTVFNKTHSSSEPSNIMLCVSGYATLLVNALAIDGSKRRSKQPFFSLANFKKVMCSLAVSCVTFFCEQLFSLLVERLTKPKHHSDSNSTTNSEFSSQSNAEAMMLPSQEQTTTSHSATINSTMLCVRTLDFNDCVREEYYDDVAPSEQTMEPLTASSEDEHSSLENREPLVVDDAKPVTGSANAMAMKISVAILPGIVHYVALRQNTQSFFSERLPYLENERKLLLDNVTLREEQLSRQGNGLKKD